MIDTTHEIRIKRLRFRSWHRGCKETDLILGTYADHKLAALSTGELDIYEALLEEHDADIWNWISEREPCPEASYLPLIETLRNFRSF